MNIFYLDENARTAAQYHANIHVNKMIIETAQMLCTAHRILDADIIQPEIMYKATHKNHPSAVWVRDSLANYVWTYTLFYYLCDEYTYRYNKVHLTDKKLRDMLTLVPTNINSNKEFVAPPQCMPDEYKNAHDTVTAYRNYYINEKKNLLKYTKRDVPFWVDV